MSIWVYLYTCECELITSKRCCTTCYCLVTGYKQSKATTGRWVPTLHKGLLPMIAPYQTRLLKCPPVFGARFETRSSGRELDSLITMLTRLPKYIIIFFLADSLHAWPNWLMLHGDSKHCLTKVAKPFWSNVFIFSVPYELSALCPWVENSSALAVVKIDLVAYEATVQQCWEYLIWIFWCWFIYYHLLLLF